MFIAMCEQREQHFHFFAALLDIADIVQNDNLELVEPAQLALQFIIAFGDQEATDELESRDEEDAAARFDERMTQASRTVGFPGARQAKKEQVLAAVDKGAGLQLGQESPDTQG